MSPPNRFGDTWLYNTTFTPADWSQCTSSDCYPINANCDVATPPPCARYGHRMTWYDDGTNHHLVMFGAGVPKLLNDLWFFSGGPTTGDWEKCDTSGEGCGAATPPEPRCCVGLAFDPVQKKILMFGGAYKPEPSACDDTWSWSRGAGWVHLAGTQCDTVP